MKGIKISFINPPFLKNFSRPQRSPAVTKSGTLYYPMWLSYAAGFAEQGGHEIDLLDAPADDLDRTAVIQKVSTFGAQLAVVETSTPSIVNDVQFCEELKKTHPGLFVVLVGTHVSALPEESLNLSHEINAIAIGEFDQTISDIADSLASSGTLAEIPGLCYHSPKGPKRTAIRSPLGQLDDLPMVSSVYQRFLDINNYFNPNALFPMVTITTSRGCPHRCIFCVYPQTMMGHSLRLRSAKNVVDEVDYIVKNLPAAKAIYI
jgi:anaerobic magnesium-protoporphyrin IX monomethyl ester cyclase